MICGNAAAGYCICPVCGQRHADSMLPIAIMRAAMGDEGFMGWALCPQHESLAMRGLVALVEVVQEPDGETMAEQMNQIERTGNIAFIAHERWGQVFTQPPPRSWPLILVNPRQMVDVEARATRSLH